MKKEEDDLTLFSLHDLSDSSLDYILAMPHDDRLIYIDTQIKTHYPTILDSDDHYRLLVAYESSFIAEKIYRCNKILQDGFTPIYTKTGLIRNIVNDRFFTDDDLITH